MKKKQRKITSKTKKNGTGPWENLSTESTKTLFSV